MKEFVNPANLPVEKLLLTITDAGVIQEVKALDPYWVEKRDLKVYERPPSCGLLVFGAIDAWRAKTAVYLEDLKWLLALEHHRFWSTILYHPQCMDFLISFLQEADPPYLPPHESKDVQKLYEDIRRFVLIIFSRLITNKESKSQWMSKDFMGDILYNHFIFTIPTIWDICLVYGVDNAQHVSRLLTSLFTLQPQYANDACAAVAFVNEAFKYMIMQVNQDYNSVEPPNLPETFQGFSEIKRSSDSGKKSDKLTTGILKDMVIHLLDTAMTLRIFIEAYPKAVDIYRKSNLVLSIVQLYEYGIPQLYEKLAEVGDETSTLFTEIEVYIDSARIEIIDIFKEMLAAYKNAILTKDGSIESHVENFLAVMMDGLSEKLLISDYNACYPVNEDLDMLCQAYPHIDNVKTDFILQAIYSNVEGPIPPITEKNIDLIESPLTNGHIEIEPGSSADTEIPNNIKEESLISEVKDILPHLGDGFILKCLQHYGFNSETVINSILEDNLAEPLKRIDQSLPIIPDDPLDKKFLENGIQRLNVFDGDEFDIMTRDDVDVTRIHIGKRKSKYKNLQDMLDDKSVIKDRTDIYRKYNMVCEERALYSDEYDDTYDSDGVEPRVDIAPDDARRPFVVPRVLRTAGVDQEISESTDSEEEEKPSISRNPKDFCLNPEEMRARREANMQARRAKGHRPTRNVDVTGKPRGQGQEKEVIVSRDQKEKNKSSRGNHNRRQGAQWKRSQGMMPS